MTVPYPSPAAATSWRSAVASWVRPAGGSCATVLLYATALAGLRLGTSRTIAQVSMFDFVTAVATGAIIGRTATASSTSYVQGAVAVVTLVVVHGLVSLLRYLPAVHRGGRRPATRTGARAWLALYRWLRERTVRLAGQGVLRAAGLAPSARPAWSARVTATRRA